MGTSNREVCQCYLRHCLSGPDHIPYSLIINPTQLIPTHVVRHSDWVSELLYFYSCLASLPSLSGQCSPLKTPAAWEMRHPWSKENAPRPDKRARKTIKSPAICFCHFVHFPFLVSLLTFPSSISEDRTLKNALRAYHVPDTVLGASYTL